jgi:flavin-dependent dehydrogenase
VRAFHQELLPASVPDRFQEGISEDREYLPMSGTALTASIPSPNLAEEKMYDAIIVGARCAGSPTAMLLARKGYQVLLLDRATFPSDTLSTHYIHQPGVARLKRWGLLEQVIASGCPPIERISLDFGPFTLSGEAPPAEGDVTAAYCPRRTVLDKILVDAAAAAGAEVREGFSVQELLFENGTVVGIRGRDAAGATVTEHARVVIGADGLHSIVARAVQAPTYNDHPSLGCAYFSYFSGVPVTDVEWYPRPGFMAIAFPTNDGRTMVAAVRTNDQFHAYRSDIEGTFMRTLEEAAPSLAERVRAGKREERWQGTADLPNFFRKPYGPGWALVGDAGYHKDPVTGEGISDAFRDAELLAEALDAGFAGREPLEQALAAYEQQRNEASMPIFELTLQLASLQEPPAEMQHLFGALCGNQEDTNRFMGLVAGTTPFQDFFAPENVGRIMAAAAERAVPA